MKTSGWTCFVLLLVLSGSLSGQELTAEDILSRRDDNMVFRTAYAEMEMVITIGDRIVSKEFVSTSQGTEKSFIEFLSPARDRGTKILKLGKVLKVYFPSAERIMRISGHMMRQSMMGSDFSYEDMTETAEELKKEYTVSLKDEEDYDGFPCYVIELVSITEDRTYFTQKIWIDKEKFIGRKAELYARSGKLLKLLTVKDIQSFKNRFYPTRITMEDKLRKDSKTEMIVKKIDFDIDIPQGHFTERNLLRK
jgi:outer membrane lipoprotein-sorting protein